MPVSAVRAQSSGDHLDSYNLNRLAVVGAVAAIEVERHHRTIVDHVVAERARRGAPARARLRALALSGELRDRRTPRANSSAAVAGALREQHLLVRRYDHDPIAGWLRITVGTREQHQRLLAALKEILV